MTSPKESLPEVVRQLIEKFVGPREGHGKEWHAFESIALLAFTEGRRAGLEEAAKLIESRLIEREKNPNSNWAILDAQAIRALAGGEGKS